MLGRVPVSSITKRLTGLLFVDTGYIKKKLFEELYSRGLKLVTGIKKGMKNVLIPFLKKLYFESTQS
ncbi:hypothetical protein MIDIC_50058 [Alphaproteobacteria bacterium]